MPSLRNVSTIKWMLLHQLGSMRKRFLVKMPHSRQSTTGSVKWRSLYPIHAFGTQSKQLRSEKHSGTQGSSRGWIYVKRTATWTELILTTPWNCLNMVVAQLPKAVSLLQWTSSMGQHGKQRRISTQTWSALSTVINSIRRSHSRRCTSEFRASKSLEK